MAITIRGGTIVDGTGAPGYRADVRIDGGRIVEIGELGEIGGTAVDGDRVIDAGGLLVTPGFVDIHTHYDPQVLWDQALSPPCWHGVTSVVAGNCGYSIAPACPEGRATLLRTLDKVEDMRLATLEAGVCWDFETYPEYLDTVARRGTLVNFGGYVGHTAVRIYVMGDDAYEREATDDEIGRMRTIVADSVRGGALGFSSDRAGFHLGDGGRPVPSIMASQAETEALMGVLGDIGQGVVHVAPGERYHWVYDLQQRIGRRLNWSSILTYPAAVARADHRVKLADHAAGRAAGADVWVQVTCRPITQVLAMSEPTAFYAMGAFKELVALDHADRHRLYADRGWRARVEADLETTGLLASRWETLTVVESASRPDLIGRSVAQIARERGGSPWDAMCDLAIADSLSTRFEITFANDDIEGVTSLMCADGAIMGLSDAGAHVGQICDAVMPTDFLSRWVRDRAVMPLEAGIRKLTGEIADVVDLTGGRGYLRVGAPADVLVLDWDALAPGPIRRVHDMPAGGDRLVADAPRGIEHMLVNGTPIRRDGRPLEQAETGRPGTVLRSRRAR
jgi:N-acyl-D-amino-acid deacylase